MKVTGINSVAYPKVNHNNQNFKGLWGKREFNWGCTGTSANESTTRKHYHPFADESDAEVEKVQKANSENVFTQSEEDPFDYQSHDTWVQVEPKLPFSRGEYEQYLRGNEYLSDETYGKIARFMSTFQHNF